MTLPGEPIRPKRGLCTTTYERWEISYDGGMTWYAFQSARDVWIWV